MIIRHAPGLFSGICYAVTSDIADRTAVNIDLIPSIPIRARFHAADLKSVPGKHTCKNGTVRRRWWTDSGISFFDNSDRILICVCIGSSDRHCQKHSCCQCQKCTMQYSTSFPVSSHTDSSDLIPLFYIAICLYASSIAFPISCRIYLLAKSTHSVASYAFALAVFRSFPVAVIPSTRPPFVTILPSASSLVPAWKQ